MNGTPPAPQSDLPVLEAPPAIFADIVFDRPLDHAYTYAVPDTLRDRIGVGKRVEAPFGQGNKGTIGYCIRVSDAAPARQVKDLTRVLDDEVMLDDHLLKLTRWMADYYLCGWGQVLHAVVPAGARENAGTKAVTFVEPIPKDQLPNPLPSVTPKQKQALDRLKKEGRPMELNQLARIVGSGPSPINGLVGKGLVRKYSERVDRFAGEEPAEGDQPADGAAPEDAKPAAGLVLNADQQRAWDTINAALGVGGYHAFLLHGVTGSGKTEIYLRAIEEVVKQGKEAIVLVPEISLTPQTIQRFKGRCSGVAVLHSHLTDAERGGYWRRIAAGYAQVVVGARSAVFAPTRKLGLIVIDEEHENSFKQESTPRYHGRDVAVMRARLADVPIVLGSATPSLESWHNAEKGAYTVLDLPSRVENRPLPLVKLVDLRHEPKTRGKHFAIGPTLDTAIRNALKAGGQVMLLLNRRGYSTHVHCPACGHVAQCQHCDLSLTFHRTKAALVCHYCGWETLPLVQCPACGQSAIRYQGLGTEKLQSEIEEKFPDRVVQRMDSDTMSKPGSHQRVLDAFRDGLIHILLGTQMIAKGLDFPNVTLVGVINADVGLHLPDFRAAERTFQILAQVAGRAGRGDKGGTVMVQTFTPEHPCISLAGKHDFVKFAALELGHRRQHGYPPYHRLARLIVRSEKEDAAAKFADQLAGAFREAVHRAGRAARPAPLLPTDGTPPAPVVRVLGPAECPVFKLNDYYRFHFQLQSENSGQLHEVLREVLAVAKPPYGVEFQVDVDPYSML
ncbi:replication restart helicase PriA [Fimbriiglobus ruber]|uniref:Replication restart protein PriA n=1 Tax=Fimbriiglobus ruber TaxID=1908690 RepID=A0A225DGY7_9BACT|nr:primosomal protein N' [Fimbriiglobus ruber]OWK40223.1 Helicase PriA essential for oriC/DnaA-independent DNA replication [Fimbriiglobus ruber]